MESDEIMGKSDLVGKEQCEEYDDAEGEDEDEFTKNYYREQDEIIKRMRENIAQDLEDQKHEIWSCKIGDLLELIAPLDLVDNNKENPFTLQPEGQLFRVEELKGRYFYLQPLVGGEVLGMFNCDIPTFFRVLPHEGAVKLSGS